MKLLLNKWNKFLTEKKLSTCTQQVERGEIITLSGRTKVYMSDRSGKYDEIILYFHGQGSSSNKIKPLIGALQQTTSVMLIVPNLGTRPQDMARGDMPGVSPGYLQNIFNQLIQKNCFKGTRIHAAASPLKAYGHSAGGMALTTFLVRNLEYVTEARYLDASYRNWGGVIVDNAGGNLSKIYFVTGDNPNKVPYKNAKKYFEKGANWCISNKNHRQIAYILGPLPSCVNKSPKEKEKESPKKGDVPNVV